MSGDCRFCGEPNHRGLCLPEAQTLLAEAKERIRELEAKQKSPNVWNVGDIARTPVWDARAGGYREVEVRICTLQADGWVGVEYNGGTHLRSARQIRR